MPDNREWLRLDDPIANAYVMRVVVSAWRWVMVTLGVGNALAGVILTFGPHRFRAAPAYEFFEIVDLPDWTWPIVLMISGLGVLLSLIWPSPVVSIGAHTVAFIALMWWGIVAFGFLIDGRSITGAGTIYILQLAVVHLLVVISQILVLSALRED